MEKNLNKFRSVVSRAYGSGPAVRGSRRNSGRIIGEQFSGGRNQRASGSARPGIARQSSQTGDYSNFGLSNTRGGAPSRTGGPIEPSAFLLQTLGVALGGLSVFFVLTLTVVVVGRELLKDFPILQVALLPLLLAVYCGSRVGKNARRSARAGLPALAALAGAAIGVCIVGAGLFAWLAILGGIPLAYAGTWLQAPHELMEYFYIVDNGIYALFQTLQQGVYPAVPLFGAVLGGLFTRA